jgi:hypothetical protein
MGLCPYNRRPDYLPISSPDFGGGRVGVDFARGRIGVDFAGQEAKCRNP